jgi:hypothetical protein
VEIEAARKFNHTVQIQIGEGEMKHKAFFRVLLGSLFLALLFGATLPITASADEGTPPTDPDPTESIGEVEQGSAGEGDLESGEEEAIPLEESTPAGGDQAITVEEKLFDEPIISEEISVAEVSIQSDGIGVPPETEIVTLDDAGDPLPLAPVAAAETLTTADPMWCPVGVTPGSANCSDPFGTFGELIAWLYDTDPDTAGVIWIEDTFISESGGWYLDGELGLANMSQYNLTIKGGWKGSGTGIDMTSPSIFNGATLEINHWIGDVSLSDLVFENISNGSTTALIVQTAGKITLTRVEVVENAGSGVSVDNSVGTKDVIVAASTFEENDGGDGLHVISKGLVTLNSIDASFNGGSGAYINNVSVTLKGVTLLGTNVFSENLGNGLEIITSGQITAGNLVNNANSGYGLLVDNSSSTKSVIISGTSEFKFNGGGMNILSKGSITLNNISASNSLLFEGALLDNSGASSANVTLTGTNTFDSNQMDGLRILSKGIITLNKTTANGNGQSETNGYGAWLDNSEAVSARSVLINQGTFNENYEGGLYVASDGSITISKLTVSENTGKGVELSNLGANPLAPQNVIVSGFLTANLNESVGLDVQSLGAITLSFVTANGNQGNGATLDAGNVVTLTGSNHFDENWADGLLITTRGAITLSNVNANSNLGSGAILNNDLFGAVGNVTISGTSDFSSNNETGLAITSRGSVLIANFQANENLANGISIDNSVDGFQGSVTLGTSLLNWCNAISGNYETGLEISSNGLITLTNICALGNGRFESPGFGAIIDNSTGNTKAVLLNGVNSFSNNYSGGIDVSSSGKITIANLTASNNFNGFGATLFNAANVNSPQAISLTGANHVSGNYWNGLTANSFGAVIINNLTASTNGANGGSGYGAWLDNCNELVEGEGDCTTFNPQPITLSGKNSFSSNIGFGLKVFSLGSIKLNNVSASSNSGVGTSVNNDFVGAVGGVAITGTTNFFGYNVNGLQVTSRRAITISNLEASYNTGVGATLSNYANPPFPQNITISGYSIFTENLGGYGLSARTLGAITISSLSASMNGAQGAILDNAEPAATGVITLKGAQLLYDNGGSGLELSSNRTVTINSVTSSLNNGYGVSVDNRAAGLLYDVKLTGTNLFNDNDLIGLDIRTFGNIALNNLSATNNGIDEAEDLGYGVYLDNQTGASLAKVVTLTGVNVFNDNFEDGLFILSLGAIKANSLSAFGNQSSGVSLDNQLGSITAGITVTGANTFQGNLGFGLLALSPGQISFANLTANLNDSGGVKADNSASTAAVPVTISGFNTFNENGPGVGEGAGLLVKSTGNITLSNLTAIRNQFFGVQLDNQTNAVGNPSITITGVNTFSANLSTGLYIQSAGNVNLYRVVADGNVGDGVLIASTKNVTITCGSLTGNEGTGLFVSATEGLLTLKAVFAYGNAVNTTLFYADFASSRSCSLP